jgi:hypothetical protein
MRDSRNSWIDLHKSNPDSVEAAQFILKLNTQIEFVKTQKILDGDYSE